ncbi:N-acetylmuramoyl-L-alanine amidase family protein [Altericroceibacterium endophyticum]|uniref:N-acetylmuramoyl-L-alanine amidase n=1 Tax=Altericroceibacterium endophyticum TaxID=1808508 RepID=A0A6I4T551_9SPHN|nr:N-acetylmuramoyl-L-alanine amidase [Altericroceibacterium endophyticum]MXO66016.1 N-acetylmuramoyl-L-alanine amidase [Altericroceibacterium endophyticum]
MSPRFQIPLILFAPLAILGAVYLLGLTIPVPSLGRDYVVRVDLPAENKALRIPLVQGSADDTRPLVVIDAGHGGYDPGASGQGVKEKDLVLGLAQALRDQLLKDGGLRVVLTRDDDSFLALEERFAIARELNADLFISLHADSAGDLDGVSGASIYTLSDAASTDAAARFAQRENGADIVNGVKLSGHSENVNSLLVELSQRQALNDSAEFARLILREGKSMAGQMGDKPTLKFHANPLRSAALVVLRAPDMPSVLFEAGYISNPAEARWLMSAEGRRNFALIMSRAIRVYFARRSAD